VAITLERAVRHQRAASEELPWRRTCRALRRAAAGVVAVDLWLALIAVAIVWGEHVVAVGDRLRLHAPPLAGWYEWRVSVDAVPAVLLAVLAVAAGPRFARDVSWRALLAGAGVTAVAWAMALAVVDGGGGLTDPLLPGQYLRTVPRVTDLGTFLAGFTDHLAGYNIHTQGHPPGMVTILWLLDRLGLAGVGWNAVLVLAGGGASVVAALVATREVAGEARARAAAPFLVLVPAAVWWSSGDAFFAGVSTWAATLVVLAMGCDGRRSDLLAIGGGLLFGVTAFLSYGLVLVAVVPLAVAFFRRRPRPVVVAVLGSLPVFAAFLAAGFWWVSGLTATRERYFAGVASRRPYSYFLLGDLAAFAIATGPAVTVAIAWLRDRRLWLLVGGGLAMVALADLSGMSKAEVERIWIPFVPWVVIATAVLAARADPRRAGRGWLAAQGATGLLVQLAVRSPW
jgi:hypothetical protein